METINFSKAKWIWGADNKTPNQKLIIRKKFFLSAVPEQANAYVSCDTKFWMWINGKLAVFEGGVFRESSKGGYAECVNMTHFLQSGENVISFLVWYYGNGGRNNTNSGEAGFIFSCEELSLYSDETFHVTNHPAFVKTGAPYPSYLFGGDNIGFDSRIDIGDFTKILFDESDFLPATVYHNKVWGEQVLSPLPLLKLYEPKTCEFQRTKEGIIIELPYAMAFSIGFEFTAVGNELVDIRTDRYTINGGPGDEHHQYNGHRIEYIAKKGINQFFSLMYLYGEKVYFTFPETVQIKRVYYRESGYATQRTALFRTENELFNTLIEKSLRTLYVCMRNNFMDCPDRERGQWIGDVSVQTPQVFYAFDCEAQKLLKKAIYDFIDLRKGDVLVGNVPGENFSELPGQSLLAISKFGLLGEYYHYTQDKEILRHAFAPIIRYLKLWEYNEKNLLLPRKGDWYWFDHLWNVDEAVLENCLYVAAAKYALEIASICNLHEHDAFLIERIETLSANIEKYFWYGDRYASGAFVDDRANALAVLCGVCPQERYPAIRKVLLTVFNATPYMERFVLMALCEMGFVEDAYHRMMSRYYNLAINENTTLWEDFYILGTRNHAWSGCPLEIAFRYILGLDSDDGFKTYRISPRTGIFKKIECGFMVDGKIKTLSLKEDNGGFKIL